MTTIMGRERRWSRRRATPAPATALNGVNERGHIGYYTSHSAWLSSAGATAFRARGWMPAIAGQPGEGTEQ